MDFAITMHAMLNGNTEGVVPKEGFLLGTYVHVLTAKCVKMVLFPVLLCSLTWTGDKTFSRWFREIHDWPLAELSFI